MPPYQPIVLLADSQLLYWSVEGELSLMTRVRRWIDKPEPKASYVGASNGDEPAFYEIFTGAMQKIGIDHCRHIRAEPSASDWDFFDESDIVLLAGGDVRRGWQTFEKNGMKERILERYQGGALLIGVSAGAVQLGVCCVGEAFNFVPAIIDVHQEPGWEQLKTNLPNVTRPTRGLGIPTGAGAIFHPDYTLEPVRYALTEFVVSDDELRSHLILPPETVGDEPAAARHSIDIGPTHLLN